MLNNYIFSNLRCPRIPPPRGIESSMQLAEIGLALEEIDDSDVSAYSSIASESASHDHNAGGLLTIPSKHVPTHLLMVSLLEHVCSIYEPDPKMKDELFKEICSRLAQLKVMSPLCFVDELETIRDNYKKRFSGLLDSARISVYENNKKHGLMSLVSRKERLAIMFQPHINHKEPRIKMGDIFDADASRYRQEFGELKCLGRGGFGSVYKVRHKLDGCLYAVKKIPLPRADPEILLRLLREVRVLANLHHSNVVGYNAAWLQQEYIVPARVRPVDDENVTSRTNEAEDSDVVFQNSGMGSNSRMSGRSSADERHNSLKLHSVDRVCSHGDVQFDSHRNGHAKGKTSGQTSMSCGQAEACGQHSAASYGYTGDLLHNSKTMLYIQMQLCSSTLKDWIHHRNAHCDRNKVFDCVNEVLALQALKQILCGVDYIHNQGLIHRDIKPRNIFYDDEFTIKIGDFGLARDDLAGINHVSVSPIVNVLDVLNVEDYTTGVGTSIYGAPEQLCGHSYDTKCDMFSVGITAFELFHPFLTEMERAKTLTELRSGVVPKEFQMRWPAISNAVVAMVSTDPRRRPSAKELLESEIFLTKDELIAKLSSTVAVQAREIAQLKSYIMKLECKK